MSTFGGPNDKGVKPDENLALYAAQKSTKLAPDPKLFLHDQPESTSGTARRLNPESFYLAMRWKEGTDYAHLRSIKIKVRNTQTRKSAEAYAVDFGPGKATGRVADLSPGLAKYLGVETDDDVTVTLPEGIYLRD